ncbi:MAG: hypothetical protein U1D55_04695 [Phycisphaerae bacterium]
MKTNFQVALLFGVLASGAAKAQWCGPPCTWPLQTRGFGSGICGDIVAPAEQIRVLLACSLAHASITSNWGCCGYETSTGAWGYQADCAMPPSGASWAAVSAALHDIPTLNASAHAWTASPNEGPELYAGFCLERWGLICCCPDLNHCWDQYPGGPVGGWASAQYGFEFTPTPQHPDWTFVVYMNIGYSPFEQPERVRRSTAIVSDNGVPAMALGMWAAQNWRRAPGMGYDPVSGMWLGNASFGGGAGSHEVQIDRVDFDDSSMDVNLDGRFNAADVATLQAAIGSSDARLIQFWDYDGDQVIDASDVQHLQLLVDLDFDSGYFGDLNGDGTPTCADLALEAVAFGTNLEDAAYNIAYDYDLNGEIETIDRERLYHLILPGDVNFDQSVAEADLGLLLSALGSHLGDANYNSAADFDNDNDVDESDLGVLLAHWGQEC